jgi:acetoin utilization deacetylase AcuC-like enzyme
MLRTGIVASPEYLRHRTPPGHPEGPERIGALIDALQRYERPGIVRIEPRPAAHADLARVHSDEHIARVAASEDHFQVAYDLDTYTSEASYRTALLASGGLLQLADAVLSRKIDNGFALVRPPGHHAEANRALGFCLFNNVAICARYLQTVHGMERILIIDWDVHHGNGTQNTFYPDREVLFISLHQYPHYPGTGSAGEAGCGNGVGCTVNVPLPSGMGNAEYMSAFAHIVDPIARQYEPQFILISAGFDCHILDPLSGMRLTEDGFRAMTRMLMRIARDHAGDRIVGVLEGGYDPGALQRSVLSVLDEMGGDSIDAELPFRSEDLPALEPSLTVQRRYWNLGS